jgi:hypothetical protein
MPLPPKAIYSSYESLYNSAQAFARQYGYAFVKMRSDRIGSRHKKVYLDCDRHKTCSQNGNDRHYE